MLNTAFTSFKCFKLRCQCDYEWELHSENNIRLSPAATALHSLRSQQLFKVPPACCRPVFSAPLSPATTLMIERDVHVIPWGNFISPSTSSAKSCRTDVCFWGCFHSFWCQSEFLLHQSWYIWLLPILRMHEWSTPKSTGQVLGVCFMWMLIWFSSGNLRDAVILHFSLKIYNFD